ncbi:hypothetical protein K440DRAFT_685745 [Wilcoxina mikolae CBS 423.85]|nr:hypothetical protein K440DRAFT_685745 [Wilcoxina mikolae CBS 423.85]
MDEKLSPSALNIQPFEGWPVYPAGFVDETFVDGESYNERLKQLSSKLFCKDPDDLNVEIVDVYGTGEHEQKVFNEVFVSALALDDHLVQKEIPTTRIISITQKNTQFPLDITEEMMRKILTFHRVSPDFLEYLFCYREKALPSDEGQGNATITTSSSGAYGYLLRYPEQNGRDYSQKWSIRRTGVYHHFDPNTKSSVFIFLHPVRGARTQARIKELCSSPKSLKSTQAHPLRLHLLLLSSYIDNWRWYLRDYGYELMGKEERALTIDIQDPDDYTLSFEALLSLRHFEAEVTPIASMLTATLPTLHSLESLNETLLSVRAVNKGDYTQVCGRLTIHVSRVKGYIISVAGLQRRTRSAIKLLADALDLKNQGTSAKINERILALTKETVDDSATVRVVTLVTLIYLPASFIATVLGMNLFSFGQPLPDGKGPHFTVSKQFWIYIALSIPLTAFTVGYWLLVSHWQKVKRTKRRDVAQELVVRNSS